MAQNGQGLRALWIDELRDLYDVENRLIKALPKMAKAANSEKLRAGFEEHLEQTKGHLDRLKEIFDNIGEKPKAKKCAGMMGIIKEGSELLQEDFEGAVMDAAIISAAQRVEHYEVAAYGCVRDWAQLLGEGEASQLLEKTLEEEEETDQKLTEIARNEVNPQAKEMSAAQEEEEEEEDEPRGRARSAKA
jgi:ferritin-like metal-binding protein YciE